MTKQEFEKLIGKYVDYETFELYERMYSATELTKQEFIKLLDIEAIPEDHWYTVERYDWTEILKEATKRLHEIQKDLKQWKEWANESNTPFDKKMVKLTREQLARWKIHIEDIKAHIDTLKP